MRAFQWRALSVLFSEIRDDADETNLARDDHRGSGNVRRKDRAVLAQSRQFPAAAGARPALLCKLGDVIVIGVDEVIGNERPDVLPDQLMRCVAKGFFTFWF